jgi:hypothetical protein
MARRLLIVALLAWLMPVVMPRAFAYGGPCIDVCDDDEPAAMRLAEEPSDDQNEGPRSGDCGDCACCAHLPRVLTAAPPVPRPASRPAADYLEPAGAVPSAATDELLRVPIGGPGVVKTV